jgi:DNA-binding transcriptional MerR regulator
MDVVAAFPLRVEAVRGLQRGVEDCDTIRGMSNMQPNKLAKHLNVSAHTLRRWCNEFAPYLSPGAAPPKGNPRLLNEHDQRVMMLVASLRGIGYEHDTVTQRLDKERDNSWAGLPELPPEFTTVPMPSVPVDQAASRAYEMAQVAALQTQIQYLEQRNDELTATLESAQARVQALEQTLSTLREEGGALAQDLREQALSLEREKHQTEVQLLQTRAEVARLEGELKAYSLGRGKPVNVVLIVASAVLFGVVLVVIVFIVATLIR